MTCSDKHKPSVRSIRNIKQDTYNGLYMYTYEAFCMTCDCLCLNTLTVDVITNFMIKYSEEEAYKVGVQSAKPAKFMDTVRDPKV